MSDEKKKITREDLKKMPPEEIEKARLDGRLDHLMGIEDKKSP